MACGESIARLSPALCSFLLRLSLVFASACPFLFPPAFVLFFWHGLLHRRRQSFQGLSPYEGRAFRGGGFINATVFFPFEVRLIGVWGDTLSVAEVVVLCRTCVRRGCLQKKKSISISFLFYSPSISVPFPFHVRSMSVSFTFHVRSISVP